MCNNGYRQLVENENLLLFGSTFFYTINIVAFYFKTGKGCPAIEEGRAFGVQSLSGTGCLRVGAEFLRRQLNASVVLLSEPTWGNHNLIFKHSGYAEIKKYRYWNGAKCELDIDGMLEDLKAAPAGAVADYAPRRSRGCAASNTQTLKPCQL